MSEFLCVRINNSDLSIYSPVSWAILGADAKVSSSGYSLLKDVANDTAAPEVSRKLLVIAPSESVLLTQVHVPNKQQRHLKQVLPFLVEEQIIDPIEMMHLVTPSVSLGENVSVAALRRELLTVWLKALADSHLEPDYLFLDLLCVPQAMGDWQLLFEEEKVLFRNGLYSGVSVDQATAQTVIQIAINNAGRLFDIDDPQDEEESSISADEESAGTDVEIALINVAAENYVTLEELKKSSEQQQALVEGTANLSEFAQENDLDSDGPESPSSNLIQELAGDVPQFLSPSSTEEEMGETNGLDPIAYALELDSFIRSENIETRSQHFVETSTELLAVSAVQRLDTALNLLQGDFRPLTANAENKRFAKKAALIAAGCLSVFLLFTLGGGFYLESRADGYFDKSVAIYRSVFPKQRKVHDPVSQMRRQMNGKTIGGTTSDFLPLLDAASKALASLDSEQPTSITQLRYDSQRGSITIDISGGTIDQLESYKDLLASEGLSVDILSANQDGDTVKGRIQIGRN